MFESLDEASFHGPARKNALYIEMVMLARKGDRTAFSALFYDFNAPICTYLARLLDNDELGRALAQETFLQAWQLLPNVEGEVHFKCWLYSLATHLAQAETDNSDPYMIQWLPWRASLLLHVLGGFSHSEIAQIVQINERSVDSYISRGRDQWLQSYHGEELNASHNVDTSILSLPTVKPLTKLPFKLKELVASRDENAFSRSDPHRLVPVTTKPQRENFVSVQSFKEKCFALFGIQ